MNYQIKIDKQVYKFLAKAPQHIVRAFVEKADFLSLDPKSPLLDTVILTGYQTRYRLRIGKYRFLYEINNTEVFIFFYKADSRGDVYK